MPTRPSHPSSTHPSIAPTTDSGLRKKLAFRVGKSCAKDCPHMEEAGTQQFTTLQRALGNRLTLDDLGAFQAGWEEFKEEQSLEMLLNMDEEDKGR